LSYTTFTYNKPTVKATKEGFCATISVTNTGNVAGKEVVQLYVSAPAGDLMKPTKELRSFAKTRELQPGERQVLTFEITNYDLASFNVNTQSWESPAGKYQVLFGANVEDIRAKTDYFLKKAFSKKVNDVLRPNRKL
jgi:beta-glucosidase